MNPLKAIRAKCLDCAYTANEVKLCPCQDCPLFPYRLGKNPFIKKREYTDEQRAKMREQFLANMAKNSE